MDYDELVQLVESLEKRIQELENRSSDKLSEAVKKSLIPTTRVTDNFANVGEEFTDSNGDTVEVEKNVDFDVMLEIEAQGQRWLVGAYKIQ